MIRGGDLPDARAQADIDPADATEGVFLIGLSGPYQGRCLPLAAAETQIGRQAHNDIVLDDPGISWEHAQIVRSGDQWRVLNVLSTNGTFVNGERVHEAELSDRDELAFGPVRFRFRQLDQAATAPGRRDGRRSRAGMVIVALLLAAGLGLGLGLLAL